MPVQPLNPSQIATIVATERSFSVLSITASLFVIASFLGSNLFQTPINRLIFYAAWGNILGDVAIIVARTGINNEDGALCQWQGFMINWFRITHLASVAYTHRFADLWFIIVSMQVSLGRSILDPRDGR